MFQSQFSNIANIIENTTKRRISINGFFIGVLTTILSIYGILGEVTNISYEFMIGISVFMYIITVIWQISIRTYMIHNFVYYTIMGELEKCLPINYYRFEYELIKEDINQISISKKEVYLNWLFGFGSLALGVFTFINETTPKYWVQLTIVFILLLILITVNIILHNKHEKLHNRIQSKVIKED